jgi:hypothetical protein
MVIPNARAIGHAVGAGTSIVAVDLLSLIFLYQPVFLYRPVFPKNGRPETCATA